MFLLACAQGRPASPALPQGSKSWTGRLALSVEGDAAKSFSAAFELRGSIELGTLLVFGPIGNTLAELHWSPGQSTLRANGEVRQFVSLDALVTEAIGTGLPLPSLFAWVEGRTQAAAGWEVDLSQHSAGRLSATRSHPEPRATLRLVLD